MSEFWASFKPIGKRLRKYPVEIVLITLALILSAASAVIFFNRQSTVAADDGDREIYSDQTGSRPAGAAYIVDVGGAVEKPGVYAVSSSARLKDVIDLARGLSAAADQGYFGRNFNLARLVGDQEKIYIPSEAEINSGTFIEIQRTLDYTLPAPSSQNLAAANSLPDTGLLIDINTAAADELDSLPGIGQVTVNKIIGNRPYHTIDELLSRKILNQSVFEKIKALISVD